jgi:hypothetical protein
MQGPMYGLVVFESFLDWFSSPPVEVFVPNKWLDNRKNSPMKFLINRIRSINDFLSIFYV